MNKKTKILIFLFFIFSCLLFFQNSFAKYVIEDTFVVAKLHIDRCKPSIELIDIYTSNPEYPDYANKTHLVTAKIKIVEKNIVKNNFSIDKIQIFINNNLILPDFKSFNLISENTNEKIYEFSFTNVTFDGNLSIMIPSGIVEDISGLTNDEKLFNTNIIIDNMPPVGTFEEVETSNQNSIAQITCNEQIRPISGWDFSDNILSKEFTNPVSYELPIMDLAQNSSLILIDIKKANNIMLEYGTYDDYSHHSVVSGGKIPSYDIISSNSICKTEAIYMRLSGSIDSSLLQGRCFIHTFWGDNAYGICKYSGLTYYHGYNLKSKDDWIDSTSNNTFNYNGKTFIQLGGIGLNIPNAISCNVKIPIPNDVAKQYLYGISGIQFRLNDNIDYSIVYQAYVKDVGWLGCSCDGQENLYNHTKPISTFRMNIIPKSEKQFLINYWNKDVSSK